MMNMNIQNRRVPCRPIINYLQINPVKLAMARRNEQIFNQQLDKPQSPSAKSYTDMEVYHCSFQLYIQEATMTIKFPCSYVVEVKPINGKSLIAMTRNKVPAINSVSKFNQTLKFETELLYNSQLREFQKKDVLLLLNLISNRRPDQMKLVGRIPVDLGQLANTEHYSTLRGYKLEYCSVDAHIVFKGKITSKRVSDTMPEKFDKDSFSDYQSFIAGIHNSRDYGNPAKKPLQAPTPPPPPSRIPKQNDRNRPPPSENMHSYSDEIMDKLSSGRGVIEQEEPTEEIDERGRRTNRTSHKIIDKSISDDNNNNSKNHNSREGSLNWRERQKKDDTIVAAKNLKPKSSRSNQNLFAEDKDMEEIKNQFANPPPIMLSSQVRNSQTQKNQVHVGPRKKIGADPSGSFYSSAVNQTHHQYEQILRNSHAQEKRIWDEEKRILNEQISREKMENIKLRERSDAVQKKMYENQLKLNNMEGKIENSKRQMLIFERQKNLQMSEMKNRLERALKEKEQAVHLLQISQSQTKDFKSTIGMYQGKIRESERQFYEKEQRLTEALANSSSNIANLQKIISQLREQAGKDRNISDGDIHAMTKRMKEVQQSKNKLEQKLKDIENEAKLKSIEFKEKESQYKQNLEQVAHELKLETAVLSEKIKGYQEKIGFRDQQIEKLQKSIQKYRQQNDKLYKESKIVSTQQKTSNSQKIEQLQNTLKKFKEQNQKLKAQHVNNIKQIPSSKQNQCSILKEKIEQLEGIIQRGEKEKKRMILEIEDLQNSLENIQKTNNNGAFKYDLQEENIGEGEGEGEGEEKHQIIDNIDQLLKKQQEIKGKEENEKEQKKEEKENKGTEKINNLDPAMIENLQNQINYLKEYQQSLQEKVLEDFQKTSMLQKELEITQERCKILEQELEKLNGGEKEIKCQPSLSPNKEELLMEQIKELEQQLRQIDSHQLADEDYLNLQEKLNQKNEYIDELEEEVKMRQKEWYELENDYKILKKKLKKILKEREDPIAENKESLVEEVQQIQEKGLEGMENMDNTEEFNFDDGMIRVVRVNSENSDPLEQSQPRESQKNQLQSFEAVINVISAHSESSANRMLEDEFEAEISGQVNSQGGILCESQTLNKNESFHNNLQTLLEEKQQQIEHLRKIQKQYQQLLLTIEMKTETFKNEKNQLLQKNSQLTDILSLLKKENDQLVGKTPQKVFSEESSSQLVQTIDDLTKTLKEYEDNCVRYEERIEFLNNKEIKMEETLAIIEEESQKIITELEDKEAEIQSIREELHRKNKIIEEILESKDPYQNRQIQERGNNQDFEREIEEIRAQYENKIQIMEQRIEEKTAQIQYANKLLQQQTEQKIIQIQEPEFYSQQFEKKIAQLQSENQKLKAELQKSKNYEETIKNLQIQIEDLAVKLEENKRHSLKSIKQKEYNNSEIKCESNVAFEIDEKNNRIQFDGKIFTIDNIQELESRIQELEISLFSHQANENQRDIKISELQSEIQAFKNLIKAKEGQIYILLEQLKSMENKTINKKSEGDNSPEIQQKEKDIIISEQKFQQIREQLEEKVKFYEQKIDDKEIQVFNLSQVIEQKQSLIKSLRENVDEVEKILENERNQFYEKKEIMREELTNNEDQIIKKEDQIKALKYKMESMSLQLDMVKEELQNIKNLPSERSKVEASEIKQQNMVETVEMKVYEDLKGEYKFCSEQLKHLTHQFNSLEQKITQIQNEKQNLLTQLQQVRFELQLANQQNQMKEAQQQSNNKNQDPSMTISIRKKDLEILQLQKQVEKIFKQKEIIIEQYEERIKALSEEKEKLMADFQEKQMENINNELQLQMKLKEKNDRSQMSINQGHLKKSMNVSQEAPMNDLLPACRILKQLLNQRTEGEVSEIKLESLMSHIIKLEEQVGNSEMISKEKTIILEKTRTLSMEFSKFKSAVMKSKIQYDVRSKFLSDLKPMEKVIKEILNLAEILSENLIDMEFKAVE